MGSNSCYTILKWLVVVINCVFWITGLAIVAFSIWLLTDPSAYLSVTQDENSFKSGVYVLLAIGLLILVVGILGCCGACSESQCLLVLFFCVLLVVIAAEIAACAWAYTNKDDLKSFVKVNLQKTIEEEYGIIKSRTTTIDTIQEEFHCCGSNGPRDWANSQFNNKKNKLDLSITSVVQTFEIPASCCKKPKDDALCKTGRIGHGTLPISSVIYEEGCYDKINEYFLSAVPICAGIIAGFAIFQILGLILSLILCCAVSFVDRYKA